MEMCAREVEHREQVLDQGLQPRAEVEEKVKKLQQEKTKDEGRANDEDVVMGPKEEGRYQGSKAAAIREVFEDIQAKLQETSNQQGALSQDEVARGIQEAAIKMGCNKCHKLLR